MSFEWNVYKLFKNGRRAKAPFYTYTFDGTKEESENYFCSTDKAKSLESKYVILNAADNQERIDENESEKNFTKKKNRVLAKILQRKKVSLNGKRCIGGLIYCKESSWKWQWAALEAGTNQYVTGLSSEFSSYEAAKLWMETQINDYA